MLDKRQIAMLHIEKSKARLSDEAYRQILRDVADVSSSKDESLGDYEFGRLVKAIKAAGSRRPGWQEKQIAKFRQYAGLCKLSEPSYRKELFKLTGQLHEESVFLGNEDFDLVMAQLEARLESLAESGEIARPSGIDLEYWRNRLPQGKLTTRQRHEAMNLWVQLQPHLEAEKRTFAYFNGFVRQTLRLAEAPEDIGTLSRRQGVILVDALKRRIEQEERRVEKAVPF